jgi:TolB protein
VAFVDATSVAPIIIGPLAVIDVATGERTLVSDGEVFTYEWSPDGALLLFAEFDAETSMLEPRIWDGATTTSFEPFEPTPLFVAQYLPFWDQYTRALTTWAPTSDAFVYGSSESGQGEVWVQPVRGPRRSIGAGEFASWLMSFDDATSVG